ncbi:hypothetical protein DV515_00004258 [Chloebia gouldiae]|uniref:Uncharacterized protein n=1 Tax=Chloebia gouldiae TaxID=44316 RepID=A0A3L8ST67_CHLGU|nr:hypothetical protein DV515_00004258 [Chloebia gouldiae]
MGEGERKKQPMRSRLRRAARNPQEFRVRDGDGWAPGYRWRRAPIRPSPASLTLDVTEGSRGIPGGAALRGPGRVRRRPGPDLVPWASRRSPQAYPPGAGSGVSQRLPAMGIEVLTKT